MPTTREHFYHAEALAIHGDLKRPYPAKIERKAHAKVYQPKPGYESQQGKPFRVEGVVSYSAAYTQASGHLEDPDPERNKKGGYKTLSTAVVENLNILNVVTADRIVSQISTEHPLYEEDGHVPVVTFLGTQFVNLRIGGFPVEVELDLDLLDPGKHDCKLGFPQNPEFTKRIEERVAGFRAAVAEIVEKITATKESKTVPGEEAIKAFCDSYGASGNRDGKECTDLSLVKSIKTSAPWVPIGNVFDVPHFGQIRLGVVRIEHSDHDPNIPKTTLINVNMVEVNMGCIASGTARACCSINNGGSGPPKPSGSGS